MRLAKIENGEVVDVVIADHATAGLVPCSEEVDRGWRYDNEQFHAPRRSLEEIKQTASLQIQRMMSHARLTISGQADATKLASWNDKAGRASRILANAASEQDRQILQTELDARDRSGETLQSLAQTQKAKAESLALKAAKLSGLEKKALHELEGKRSENTVNALLEQVRLQTQSLTERSNS